MHRGDVIAVLDDLIETSLDGEEGFRTCAANAKRLDLRAFFEEKATRCRAGAAQLQEIVREMGAEPRETSSMSGAAHRFWVNIRGMVSGMGDAAILDECERGEDIAQGVYENALRQELPGDVRRVIERQYREVRGNHERVRELRGAIAV